MIVENPSGNVFSGGRVHAVSIAMGLQVIGHQVTFITQHPPIWWANMARYYEMPAMILTHNPMNALKDVRYADLVITYPIDWTAPGLELARAIGVPHWAFVLDAWPIISKWAPAVAKRMHFSDGHTKAFRDSDLLLTI